jgi:membrane protease YdiL (CAAX protease family)
VIWRVGLPWYVIALGLPTVLSLTTAALAYLLGETGFILRALAPIELVLFVAVVGEELGWRGYALPRLLEKFSPLIASLILGVLWGLWHVPTFVVPGTPQYGLPPTAFVLLTIEYSILMTWVFLHTAGSVLIATLFHGAINLSQGVFLAGVDGATRYWLLCIGYGIGALIVAIVLGLRARQRLLATS